MNDNTSPATIEDDTVVLVSEIRQIARRVTERNKRMMSMIDEYRARWAK